MITKTCIYNAMTRWLKAKLTTRDLSSGLWPESLDLTIFEWILSPLTDDGPLRIIGVDLSHDNNDNSFIVYDIWTNDRKNINIKIRNGAMEFVEDSKFQAFTKEEMKDLYDKIKNTRIIKCVLNEEDIK